MRPRRPHLEHRPRRWASGSAEWLVAMAILVLTFLFYTPVVQAQSANRGCYSLANSKYCGTGFGGYQLSQFTQVGGEMVSNVVQFDRALDKYFGSRADLADTNTELGCTKWDGQGAPRYRISYLCRSLLANAASQQCNLGVSPPALCKDTCLTYTDGWKPIITNSTACPNQAMSKIIWNDLVSSCSSPYYSGSSTNQCVDGAANEDSTCGFTPNQTADICAYCSGSASGQDACCRKAIPTFNCPSNGQTSDDDDDGNQDEADSDENDGNAKGRMSPGRIAAIVVPSVLGGLLLLALLALLLHRRRKVAAEKNELFPHVLGNGGAPSGPSSSQRLLGVGAGIAGAATTAAALAANNASTESFEPVQCRVVYPFTPRMDDELQLTPGDVLLLIKIFDDGWAVANNLTTGREGAIPLVCVTPYQTEGAHMAADSGTDAVAAAGLAAGTASRGLGSHDDLTSSPNTSPNGTYGSRAGTVPMENLSADEIERSLTSLNASAAAIAAAVSAVTSSHGSIASRSNGAVHDSQLPRRSSSRRPKNRGGAAAAVAPIPEGDESAHGGVALPPPTQRSPPNYGMDSKSFHGSRGSM
ncbi:hypothetical protein IWQ60_001159 [Tieghemiomyces parasiticus]|uniref:SH3 domain-containing protein n=1 Tax=Tieghemiomyces parasiticus TaxID=78921 RepID=A0A9W8AL52_9FUNG|nr:hypothetical protein IWQ60_001159 [Tieghemiomyces parasiticus]